LGDTGSAWEALFFKFISLCSGVNSLFPENPFRVTRKRFRQGGEKRGGFDKGLKRPIQLVPGMDGAGEEFLETCLGESYGGEGLSVLGGVRSSTKKTRSE